MKKSFKKISIASIKKATSPHINDYLNKILYDMCENAPGHTSPTVINAKFSIIGRTYAAALERTSKKNNGRDIFTSVISKIIKDKKLDSLLKQAKKTKLPTSLILSAKELAALENILAPQVYLASVLRHATGIRKNSLISKYLHFHLPEIYPIYDKYSKESVARFTPALGKAVPLTIVGDETYPRFFLRCLMLRNSIIADQDQCLNMRQLDNFLLAR